MKMFKQTIALFLSEVSMILCACGCTSTAEPTLEPVVFSNDPSAISAASESVVMLNCYDRNGELYCTGSAFQCFEEGIFVTNYHVIDEVDKIQGSTESKLYFDLDEVIAADEERDIAILKTSAKPGVAVLPCGDSDALIKGENVVAIGSPKRFLNTVSKGTYSGMTDFDGQSLIQFNASVSSGSSGGALFNDEGEVIGITSSQYSEGDDLNFAVPMSDVEEVWENKENFAAPTPKPYDGYISVKEFYENPESILDDEIIIGAYVSAVIGDLSNNTINIYLTDSKENVYNAISLEDDDVSKRLSYLYMINQRNRALNSEVLEVRFAQLDVDGLYVDDLDISPLRFVVIAGKVLADDSLGYIILGSEVLYSEVNPPTDLKER